MKIAHIFIDFITNKRALLKFAVKLAGHPESIQERALFTRFTAKPHESSTQNKSRFKFSHFDKMSLSIDPIFASSQEHNSLTL
jgi:hypothetical protein